MTRAVHFGTKIYRFSLPMHEALVINEFRCTAGSEWMSRTVNKGTRVNKFSDLDV